MGKKRDAPPPAINALYLWVRRRSMNVKALIGAFFVVCVLVALKIFVRNTDHFYVASESVHAIGLLALIYKLIRKKSCAGLSLKTQELTAVFIAVRLFCSFTLEADIHTMLDSATLVFTLWVIYMIRFKLNSTYTKELDNMRHYILVVPCVILAVFSHPWSIYWFIHRMLWAFATYLEAISVLPQLRLMQNAKMIEPFTAHYVFALGVARFFACAQWIIQIYETKGSFLFNIGSGYFWLPMMILAEIVQTFILADFCYYYVKSWREGQLVLRMPV